jgi:2-dehydropantoate 2-reductase
MGAVGTAIAAHLALAGHPLLACQRTRSGSGTVSVVTATGERSATCTWVRRPAESDDRPEAVVVATKAQDTPGVRSWLSAWCDATTPVLLAQNGIDHAERAAGLAGRVVPTLVYLNVDHLGPGRAFVRRTGRDLVVPDDDGGRRVRALLAASELTVECTPDFVTEAWSKLLTNVTVNPVTALTGRRCEVLRDERVAALVRDLLTETAQVGRAAGARLGPDIVARVADWVHALPPDAATSMLQDRERGRPLEWEGLTGAVVRAADRHGVEAPLNRALLALLANCGP